MKLRDLAWANVRGNARRYAAFFLSSTFSAAIFFLYAQFILHPDVVHGRLRAAAYVRRGMIACEYIIAAFAFFFILYSLSAFLKARSREFGLLALFGMTDRQLRRMLVAETMIIAFAATTAGIAIGLMFSKLFLAGLSALLEMDSPIRFTIVWEAVALTYAVFMGMFATLLLVATMRLGRKTVVERLRDQRAPKPMPIVSPWLAALAVALIGAGYVLAYTSTPMTVVLRMLPVTALVVVGTYFLFTQGSVAALRLLRRLRSTLRGTRLLVVAQLTFKLTDNARLLASVATLSAVAVTAAATLYVFYMDFRAQTIDAHPYAWTWFVRGDNEALLQKVEQELASRDVPVEKKLRLRGVSVFPDEDGDGKADGSPTLVVSESAYRAAAGKLSAENSTGNSAIRDVPAGHAVRILPPGALKSGFWKMPADGVFRAAFAKGAPADAVVRTQIDVQEQRLHTTDLSVALDWLVVDDSDYDALERSATSRDRIYTVYGLEPAGWKKLSDVDTALRASIFVPANVELRSRIVGYRDAAQTSSLTLFVGTFVCALFFTAAGSMIYFRMFTELQDERALYRSLARIGVTEGEMRRIIGGQLAVVFFLPFLISIAHAAFAMKALANLLLSNIWGYALTVAAVFLAAQAIAYLAARRVYWREIMRSPGV